MPDPRLDTPLPGGVAWLDVTAPLDGVPARVWTGPLGLQILPLADAAGGGPRAEFLFRGGRLRGSRCTWSASTIRGGELHRPARPEASATAEPAVQVIARVTADGSVFDSGSGASHGVLRVIDAAGEYREQFVENTHVYTLDVPALSTGLEPAGLAALIGTAFELTPLQLRMLEAGVALLLLGQDELTTASHRAGVDRYLGALAGMLLRTVVAPSSAEQAQTESLRLRVDVIIRAQIEDPQLTPAVIAAQLNISLRQLYRAFTGAASPAARIRQARLERAARLLASRAGQCKVDRVAEQCGFVSAEYFSRAFRREFGVSPRAYRSAHRDPAARL